jgi:hypothetical protein
VTFPNTTAGIATFREWINTTKAQKDTIIIGIEGGSTARNALVKSVLEKQELVFEVNPLYIKHKRSFGRKAIKPT